MSEYIGDRWWEEKIDFDGSDNIDEEILDELVRDVVNSNPSGPPILSDELVEAGLASCKSASNCEGSGGTLRELSIEDLLMDVPNTDEPMDEDDMRQLSEPLPPRDDVIRPDQNQSTRDDTNDNESGDGESSDHRPARRNNCLAEVYLFIIGLLLDPMTCPRIIRWEDYEKKTFRFVDPEEVAELSDTKERKNRGTGKMTIQTLERAMRYHYRSGNRNLNGPVLFVSPKDSGNRTGIHQFGPDATEFETDDPNFERLNKQ